MEQIISADAARAYLHISKRKFLYMLQNGYIRYEDNGNKTHRYSLRMCDVEALRKEMTNHPERFADPVSYTHLISTNLRQDEMRSRYGDRITSRIFGEFAAFMLTGTDVRAKKLARPHSGG